MFYKGVNGEYFQLKVASANDIINPSDEGFSILWLKPNGINAELIVDGEFISIEKESLVFLSDFHKVQSAKLWDNSHIKFNQSFYCIIHNDIEVGCKGLLFFGSNQLPIITIEPEDKVKFDLLLEILTMELNGNEELKEEMLQMLLKRFIILCTRLYKKQTDYKAIGKEDHLIRDFCYWVECHFRQEHQVGFYANLLNKSTKTISKEFQQNYHRSPLQVIHDRLVLEIKRQISFSNLSLKEIAFYCGFNDAQSFSRFFKSKVGLAPFQYRLNVKR
jgi:AraC family transcriptional activator of pobA